MSTCEQMRGMTILQHGLSVGDYYQDLYNHIFNNTALQFSWDIPIGLVHFYRNCNKPILNLTQALTYARYHDCGKPLCLTFDCEGRQHFDNHAKVSYDTWMNHTNDELIGWYILHDMDLHTLRGENVLTLLQDDRSYSLLLMSYAEVHSNASMFGGIQSTSFKIKRKNLDKIYKKLCVDNQCNIQN